MFDFIQLSSLEKVFLKYKKPAKEFTRISVLKNETFSYQIAYVQIPDDGVRKSKVDFKVTVNSPLKDFVVLRNAEYIPASYVGGFEEDDTDYLSKEPGLYPDLLKPLSRPNVELISDSYFSLWITVKLDGSIDGGIYPIEIVFDGENGEKFTKVMEVEIININLPEQELTYTQWFHTDCIATAYNTRMFSEKHWELIEKFMTVACQNGINMILTPIFTPPLDTQIGGERPTVQLVDVEKNGDAYIFGFDKLRRWISLAKKCGIKKFEMSHLFSQWGAKTAPKIIAKVKGKNKRIFGWETPATSESYKVFLNAFLPELIEVLKDEGIDKDTVFHISDEPNGDDQLQNYILAKNMVSEHLKDFTIIDALSHIDFYKSGAVEKPVPLTATVHDFIDEKIEDLWTYYCCGAGKGMSNRFFAMPSYRNRAIALQLYKYDIKGFLHWGYNFYYSQFSREIINPFYISDARSAFPAGDAFSVYPGTDGPLESIRLNVFYDALQDIRAFKLLEKYTGKEEVVKLIEETVGMNITFKDYPHSAELLLELRKKVNQKIKNCINN